MPTAEQDTASAWTRRKLQLLLTGAALITTLIGVGGVWWLITVLHEGPPGHASANTTGTRSPRDQLAARSLPSATLDQAQPGTPLSSGTTGTTTVPPPRSIDAGGVATGFPHSPSGALAQLAAIDSAALTSASVPGAQEVIAAWAAPGGPTPQTWSGVHAVAALLQSAGLPSDGDQSIAIGVKPSMGLVKGTVGDDFVIPCIDFIVTATLADPAGSSTKTSDPASGDTNGTTGRTQRVAAADCQRMVWQSDPHPAWVADTEPGTPALPEIPATEDERAPDGETSTSASGTTLDPGGRWVIGPGSEPAQAPSLWPGSQASFDAGYQWLEIPQ